LVHCGISVGKKMIDAVVNLMLLTIVPPVGIDLTTLVFCCHLLLLYYFGTSAHKIKAGICLHY